MGKLRPRGGRSQLKVTEESEAEPQSLDSCTRVLKYVLKSEGLGGRECLLHWSFKKKDCCSVAKSCPALCDPIACSTPGSSLHYLPDFAQIHVEREFKLSL